MRHQEHGSTEDDHSFRRRTFAHSRAVFRTRWRQKLQARYTRSLAWQSIMQLPGGYATSCREMMRALDAEGVRLTYSYAYDGWATVPAESERTGDHLLDIIRSRHSPDRPPVSVTYAQGDALTRNRGRYKIGFTKRSCVTSLQLRPPPRPENRAAAGEGLTTKGIITLR